MAPKSRRRRSGELGEGLLRSHSPPLPTRTTRSSQASSTTTAQTNGRVSTKHHYYTTDTDTDTGDHEMTPTDPRGAFPPPNKEMKRSKILTRIIWGIFMAAFFFTILWLGHVYVVLLILAIQTMLFKELVNVRYRVAKEREVPLFRTLQWTWFAVAIFYTYGDFVHHLTITCPQLYWLNSITQYHGWFSFLLYTVVFVGSVLTLKKGLYKYQVGQLAWTVVILLLIVGQLKFAAHIVINGLFWFFFPAGAIIINDIMAYVCGMTFGRKFIKAPFLKLSPNKTWEGFIGAFICTMVFAWFFSAFLADYTWFTCPSHSDIHLFYSHGLTCTPNPIFTKRTTDLPASLGGGVLHVRPIQLHGLVLAGFASLVAPFGGFLMSGIKRAYSIKDFDSLIPGHGGVTDRMDCQLVMIMATWVHYTTFVSPEEVTVEKVLNMIESLAPEARHLVLERLKHM